MNWVTGVMAAWGVACLVLGTRVRTGASRTFYSTYRTSALWRNAAFALLPFGIWLLAGAGAIAASKAGIGIAVGVLTPLAFVALILSAVWLFKPPEVVKPRWLRQVESGAIPEPSDARRIYLPRVVYWGLWMTTAAVFVLWLVLHWPWGVLVGVGAAVSTLLAHAPRKRPVKKTGRRSAPRSYASFGGR